MTSLLSQVTPLTRGLLWFTNGKVNREMSSYKDVDYLLNGLLTATLTTSGSSSGHVLLSENFGQPFYVFVSHEVVEKEIRSFFELLSTQISGEATILMIDEAGIFEKVQKLIRPELKSRIQSLM